jgi:hypothetical protein
MACMFNTLYRIKNLIYLESATPAVDQPVDEVVREEVDKMLVFHFTTITLAHSCHAALFY